MNNTPYRLNLIREMVNREIQGRYRGSVFGIVWSMITPLLMLGIYTFVFGFIFKSRWIANDGEASTWEFSVILFSGLIIFQIMADTLTRAPTLIIDNANYVKRVVFPIEILIIVSIGNALFHALISIIVLMPILFIVFGQLHFTILWAPIVLLPFLILICGLGWILCSLGTYLRDIGQFIGTAVTALLFLSPIFFPPTALPDWLQPWLNLNPLTTPVTQLREVMIFGHHPDFVSLAIYSGISVGIGLAGYAWFQKTRKGFSDVL